MRKKDKPLSEREDLVQVKKWSELKIGDVVIVGVIPGKEKEIKIEPQPNRVRQINYADFWKTSIRQGYVFKRK
jgi:hypothetical protein